TDRGPARAPRHGAGGTRVLRDPAGDRLDGARPVAGARPGCGWRTGPGRRTNHGSDRMSLKPTTTRRECLQTLAGSAAALALGPIAMRASIASTAGIAEAGDLITRAIPSTGERLPIVGLGSSASFSQVARSEDS